MIPDPVAFVGHALVARGALVEAVPGGLDAILPMELARELGVGEAVVLVARADGPTLGASGDTLVCGLGTAALERHVAHAREQCPRADVRMRGGVRTGHARSLAERFVVRNGKAEIREAGPSSGLYLLATVAWVVETDDRFEGLLAVALDPSSGATPDPRFAAVAMEQGQADVPASPSRALLEAGASMLAGRVPALLHPIVAPIAEQAERRSARDHARIVGYYGALAVEAAAARRRLDAAALASRIDQFARERDGKLAELRTRYAMRVTSRLAAVSWIDTERASVAVRMFRRKAHRDIVLQLPPGAQALDRLACEGCGGWVGAPALCDDRLHILCETCAPSAVGRLRCPACPGSG